MDINEIQSNTTPSIVVSQLNSIAENTISELINNVQVTSEIERPQETIVRRSKRQKKSAISDDYVVYSVEHKCDLSIENDPISFKQAMNCENSEKWFNAMKEELKSMDDNNVWELVELPQGSQ